MELTYKNTEIDQINLPTTITLADNADKIFELLKSSDVKCCADSNGEKTSITFDITDIEKLSKILQPVGINKQLESSLEIPPLEHKERLIPIVNSIANLYDRKINSRNSSITAHQKHITILNSALEKNKTRLETLSGRNEMIEKLTSTFPSFKNPINALVERNEKKIDRLQNKIEKLEKQIEIHSNTIDKLNRAVKNITLKRNVCKNLSDIVRSFAITNKEHRNQSYLNALSSFNANMHEINNMRITRCNDSINQIKNDYQNLSPAAQQTAQERVTKLTATRTSLENRNKAILAANPEISTMLNRLNDNTTTQAVDRAEVMFDQAISNNNQSFEKMLDNVSVNNNSAISPTAVEVVLGSVDVISNINDKDRDMIPDKLDSSFNTKENVTKTEENSGHILLVSQNELDLLIKENTPIKVNYKQKSEDGKIPILIEKTNKPKIEKILDAMKNENRKVRK